MMLKPYEDGKLDQACMDSMRRLLKQLLCYSSTSCLWAVASSSMAWFWNQIAKAPTNRASLLICSYSIWLPAEHSKEDMQAVLLELLKRDGINPGGLQPSHASIYSTLAISSLNVNHIFPHSTLVYANSSILRRLLPSSSDMRLLFVPNVKAQSAKIS